VYNVLNSNKVAERRSDMERLKEFRKEKNMTQEAMAEKIGITLSMYEKVERGVVSASAAFMRRMKEAFPDIDINFIFFGENSNNFAVQEKKEAV
jgi:transcriptional regulator with XRE-family HTH domain